MAHDLYRPNGYHDRWTSIDNLPPPQPPADMPPMPPARTFKGTMADSYRPSAGNHHSRGHPQYNEFSFRANGEAPAYPSRLETDRIDGDSRAAQRNRRPYRGRGGGRGARILTAERPLLQLHRGEVSQKVLGSAGDPTATQKFLSADFTDSGDESMDESGSDNDTALRSVVVDNGETADAPEPPTKRRAITKHSDEGSSLPKWSNPDPYTVLPPVDEEPRKKKDVVKLIRKARIATESEKAAQSEVAANDDFISFGIENEDASEPEHYTPPGVLGAPTGPRQTNQARRDQELHTTSAPGTHGLPSSIGQIGPPPGLAPKSYDSLPSQATHHLPPKPDNHRGVQSDQDVNLGNRKRTRDDEIKSGPRRPPPPRKGKGVPPNGSLAREWVPNRDQDPTPWHVESPHSTENAGFRLHKEICDFYDFVKPRRFEQMVREDILDRLQVAVRHEMPNCDVHCFGSFAAGLYLPNADMDVVVISQSFRNYGDKSACQSNSKMRAFGRYIEGTVAEKGSVECITGAKVPIIKFVDRTTAIRVDMSFENDTGIVANDTFSFWKRQFPAMPVLVTVIKQFLMMRGMNDVSTGGLGGFSVTCLVTSLLQNMPRVQIGEVIPEHHLGEMLIEFLDFYGNQLDISRTGITMSPPGYFDKIAWSRNREVYQGNRADRLAIIDPNKPENDISGGSRIVSLIFDRFSRAHEEIMIAMKGSHHFSLLDWMLGGDYENFAWQRDHLRDLYERRWGRIEAEPLIQRSPGREYIPDNAKHNHFMGHDDPSHFAIPSIAGQKQPAFPNKALSGQAGSFKSTHSASKTPRKGPGPNTARKGPPKGIARAQRLKEKYPAIQDIPESVGAKMRKTLIAKYENQTGNLAKTKPSKPSKPRKCKVNNNDRPIGTSKKDPITID